MAPVVRVKRRVNEEPLGALMINCKKRKLSETKECDNSNLAENHQLTKKKEITTILKFAGTVQSQNASVSPQLARLSIEEARLLAQKTRTPDSLTVKSRQEMRQNMHENRFKIVNCHRAVENEGTQITIVDIEKELETNVSMSNEKVEVASGFEVCNNITPTDSDGYVYDLYVPELGQQIEEVDYMDTYISICPFDDFIYEDRFNNDEENVDSEDSNDENYFRNDYPDEEDGNESIDDEDMVRAVENFNIDQELSSDDEDYVGVYNTDTDGFQPDIDTPLIGNSQDAALYGPAYANYKARIQRESPDDDYYSD